MSKFKIEKLNICKYIFMSAHKLGHLLLRKPEIGNRLSKSVVHTNHDISSIR